MGLFAGTKWDVPPRCDRCGELESVCRCPPPEPPPPVYRPPHEQTARLAVENRSRGKQVTVIRGLAAADNDLATLLSKLKTACATGGTIADDTLELQGRHIERAKAVLTQLGYKTKG